MSDMLSKSAHLKGLQCSKYLHLDRYRTIASTAASTSEHARLEEGLKVGLLARQLFPNGIDIRTSAGNLPEDNARATKAAIESGETVIYEAAFIHQDCYAAVDVLVWETDGWTIYEVKASTQVKDEHIPDLAFQMYIVSGSGLKVNVTNLVTLNGAYERLGDLDLRSLFTVTDMNAEVLAELPLVPLRVKEMGGVLAASNEPEVPIGPHCTKPYECPYMQHCWKSVPSPSVLDLVRGGKKAWALYNKGHVRLEDIPNDAKLSEAQQRQVDAQRSGKAVIDKKKIRDFLASLRYPLHHFDFETFAPAVPLYDRTRPYQQIPFQYSVHVQGTVGAKPLHKEHLANGSNDPRETLVQQLLQAIGPTGSVLVYHAQFERNRLEELARDLPHHAPDLHGIINRLVDLEDPFKQGLYYVRAMNGSSSIKAVLPALVPELSYKEHVIQEGGTASMRFHQLVAGEYTGDIKQLRDDLLAYCGLDTLAMVQLLRVFESTAFNPS